MVSCLTLDSRTARIAAAAAAGTAAVLLAAACGVGTAGAPSPRSMSAQQAITLAAHQAGQLSSFSSTMNVKMSGEVSGNMGGGMQVRTRPSLLATADFSTIDIAGHTLPGGMQEIVTRKAIYIKMAPIARHFGKPWLEATFAQLQTGTGLNFNQLTQQIQNNNPLVQTQMLTGAKNVRAVGTQVINGVRTTHYTGSYTAAAGLARLPSSFRATEQRGLQALGIKTMAFNVWIDAQHQVRKIIVAEQGSLEQATVTMQVTGINQPVSVSLPPPGQVAMIPSSALSGH